MSDHRPNPDRLLEAVSDQNNQRGKLKIFFGACPGVGKTYAMLSAAHRKKKQGIDSVIGIVETHGRSDTAALISDLEQLPMKEVDHRGVKLKEFDIDAALSRKPSIILVDELAHTNAPNSRNMKRWQDIEELLQAGIDVYSTLNAQHLETVNDTVAKITGVVVRETVPDHVFDKADEVELIDLPVPELLQRLQEGKVYFSEQAVRAQENFFQEGNLMALREIALRKTAQRVDHQMHQYRTLHAVHDIWQAVERCLVCVGPSPFSTQLIRRTKELAQTLKAPWVAVYVEVLHKKISTEEREAVEKQLRFAESLGAETVVLQGTDISEEVLKFAREKNVTKIVLGKPTHPHWKDFLFGSFVDRLLRRSGDIDVYSISSESTEKSKPGLFFKRPQEMTWTHYVTSFLMVSVWTALFKIFFPRVELINLAMTYLIINVLISLRYGQGPALFASLMSIACFDFFFIPPYLTFSVHDARYVVTFIVMFVVTVLTSRLMTRLRQSAEAASARERFTSSLYALSREMLKDPLFREIPHAVVRHLSQSISADVVMFLGTEPELLFLEASSNPAWHFTSSDQAVAQWVFKNAKVAGLGTSTLPSAKALFFPLIASRGVLGVVGLKPFRKVEDHEPAFESSEEHFIESVLNQAALSIEKAMLSEEAHETEKEVERERLTSTLLSSVSHDLRTPLTSISGSATTLLTLLDHKNSSDTNQRRLLETIVDESDRLNRLVTNILHITRLESGQIHLRKDLHSLEEIIGSTLNRLENTLKNRPITIHLPENLPLIPLDDLLMEQVFLNLIENACRYTPEGSPIDIEAIQNHDTVRVLVKDTGPGIPVADQKKVFEKFYRRNSSDIMGTGLGLAICSGIIKIHGGNIGVENREGGGSIFYIDLPLKY